MPDLKLILDGLKLGKPHMVNSALDLGFGIDDPILEGQSLLYSAASRNKPGVTDLLIRRGANIELEFYGRTPLMASSLTGSTVTVAILLEAGADVDGCSVAGYTPLMAAIEENHPAMIRLLLKNKANVHAKDNDGGTVLDLVRAANSQEIHKLFEEYFKDTMQEKGVAGEGASNPQNQEDIEVVPVGLTPHTGPAPEEGISWQERVLPVGRNFLHGESFCINVRDEDQRQALLDLYREDARRQEVDVFDIDCAEATGSDFLGKRIFYARDMAVRPREFQRFGLIRKQSFSCTTSWRIKMRQFLRFVSYAIEPTSGRRRRSG